MVAFSLGRQSVDIKSAKDTSDIVEIDLISPSPTNEPRVITQKFLVMKVIDGDTIDLQINSKKETVRLIGIDAPESGACFGSESTIKANELLGSGFVNFENDSSQGERDRYGRLLGYVFLENGTNFAESMIKNGFAKEYTYNKPYKYQSVFKSAQNEATLNNRGLWAQCSAGQNSTIGQSPKPSSSPSLFPKASGSYTCDCSKLCSQISTCDEAYFQLNSCGCTKRDSDGDGVPCESLCN